MDEPATTSTSATSRRAGPFDAVLLVAFGGPQGPADVRPFLQNVLRGRRIPPARIEEVAHHYDLFDGVSPLTEITGRQAAGIERRLAQRGLPLPVAVGMRNWHPYLADTLESLAREGAKSVLGVIAAAYKSYSSCEQYKENVAEASLEVARRLGHAPRIVFADEAWHTADGFVAANAAHTAAARDALPPAVRSAARLIFTAHSIPSGMPAAARYEEQLLETARLVAAAAGSRDWALVYQSRSGRPEDPWLGPDIKDYLVEERAKGLEAAVLAPIGFLCDHVEVLYDLDHEAAGVCRELGLPVTRASAVNTHPAFLDALADVVGKTVARYRGGVPLPVRK
jgi:ferrochelatase